MEALDIAHLSAMHRMLLGYLMKTKVFTYRGVIAHIVVKGVNRKRGRCDFTEERVTEALDQLIAARLIEIYKVEKPVTKENIDDIPADQMSWRVRNFAAYGVGDSDLVYYLDHVKLTFDGWALSARLNLDRMYR